VLQIAYLYNKHFYRTTNRELFNMQEMDSEDFKKVSRKLKEFMQHCQKLHAQDTYLIVNRNSTALAKAVQVAAENCGLSVKKIDLSANKPYKNFPKNSLTYFVIKLQKPEWDFLTTHSIQTGT
jgi:hypothetical protein